MKDKYNIQELEEKLEKCRNKKLEDYSIIINKGRWNNEISNISIFRCC